MVFKVFSWFHVFQVKHRQQCDVLLNHQDKCFFGLLAIICDYFWWSNNGSFAMCRPSLFMMMMIVTIIMMIFKSTNSIIMSIDNGKYFEAQIARHFLFIMLPHQMSSQELSHQEWCWRYMRSQEQPAVSILATLAMGSVYCNNCKCV